MVLNGKIPYEFFYAKKLNLALIRTVGCLCYAKKLTAHDKFDARAVEAVMMGYSATSKGYILLNLTNSTFFCQQ